MRRVAVLALVLTALAGAMITVTRLAGMRSPFAAAEFLSVGPCAAQPCWHGQIPGKSTLPRMEKNLFADPDVSDVVIGEAVALGLQWTVRSGSVAWRGFAAQRSSADPAVGVIELKPPIGALQLGDAISAFGQPLASTLCWRTDNPTQIKPFIGAHLFFKGNVDVLAYAPMRLDTPFYDPTMTVWLVKYQNATAEPLIPFDAPHWYGFGKMRNDPQTC